MKVSAQTYRTQVTRLTTGDMIQRRYHDIVSGQLAAQIVAQQVDGWPIHFPRR